MEQQTVQTKRHRMMLLAAPLILFPLLTLLFWSLGGGGTSEAASNKKQGINLELPEAKLGQDKGDKMSYYDQVMADSLKYSELIKNDPNYQMDTSGLITDTAVPGYPQSMQGGGLQAGTYSDPNETRIYEKLNQLNRAMNTAPAAPQSPEASYGSYGNNSQEAIEKLERMMAMNQQSEADPEMQQLNGMLEQLLDMQHPERVQEKLRQASELRKGQAFAVTSGKAADPVSLLEQQHTLSALGQKQTGFYSLNASSDNDSQNTIAAVVHETQTLVNGSTVKLRLLNDIFINGTLIPKDAFVFGIANLSGERLQITIGSIRHGNSLFPVALSVYDLDGLDGIYIPGAITRDVAKQSADRSLQNIWLAGASPSWEAQAAGAGIEAVKSLVSKKVKLVKVTVKAGYQVLLYDNKQQQQDRQ